MTKEESLKLFRYFQQEFAKIHARMDDFGGDFDRIYTILDGMKGGYRLIDGRTSGHWVANNPPRKMDNKSLKKARTSVPPL